ncbi:hypothetical protein YUWDRAFT_01595 [Streptomyces sp. AmelKG-D3]|nr:hypothetical protein YUWDRAFT_01595 [Streptomyces sp. AmelKG-D3]
MTVKEAIPARAGGTYDTREDTSEVQDAGTGGTQDPGAHVPPATTGATVAAGRAAQELGLRRNEFELAVHLGLIAVTEMPGGGRPRVRERQVARLREEPGHLDGLVERVRTVGTAEGAALLGIVPARFTRLARAGCFSPVTFYLNRYRAVVWLYLADELASFAVREPALLGGRMPQEMRTRLEAGGDRRARNWRAQRIERMLRRTEDPWARAAVEASALDSAHLAEVVEDPYERAYLVRVRPEPVFGRPGSLPAREAVGELMLADDPDEILWRRINLTLSLEQAREDRPAPHPGDDPGAAVPATPRPAPTPVPKAAAKPAPEPTWRPARNPASGPTWKPAPERTWDPARNPASGPAWDPAPERTWDPAPEPPPAPASAVVAAPALTPAAQPPAPPSFSPAVETPSAVRAPGRQRLLTRLGWRRRKDGQARTRVRGREGKWFAHTPSGPASCPHADQRSDARGLARDMAVLPHDHRRGRDPHLPARPR